MVYLVVIPQTSFQNARVSQFLRLYSFNFLCLIVSFLNLINMIIIIITCIIICSYLKNMFLHFSPDKSSFIENENIILKNL